jgi:hypothetical protein
VLRSTQRTFLDCPRFDPYEHPYEFAVVFHNELGSVPLDELNEAQEGDSLVSVRQVVILDRRAQRTAAFISKGGNCSYPNRRAA